MTSLISLVIYWSPFCAIQTLTGRCKCPLPRGNQFTHAQAEPVFFLYDRFLITENAAYYDDLREEYDAHRKSQVRFIDVDLSVSDQEAWSRFFFFVSPHHPVNCSKVPVLLVALNCL
jgi:hypothetical protein